MISNVVVWSLELVRPELEVQNFNWMRTGVMVFRCLYFCNLSPVLDHGQATRF